MPKTYTRRATRRYKPYKSTKKTYNKKASSKRIATIAKAVVKRQAETETVHRVISGELYNDQFFYNNIFSPITQGDANGQREGDKIYAMGVVYKGFFEPTAVFPFTTKYAETWVRLTLVASTEQLNNPLFQWSAFNNDVVINGNFMHPHWNTKKHTILKTKMMRIGTQPATNDTAGLQPLQSFRKYFTFSYNFNRGINYQEAGSQYLKFKNYYLLANVYNRNNGITSPTSAVTVAVSMKLTYKDM